MLWKIRRIIGACRYGMTLAVMVVPVEGDVDYKTLMDDKNVTMICSWPKNIFEVVVCDDFGTTKTLPCAMGLYVVNHKGAISHGAYLDLLSLPIRLFHEKPVFPQRPVSANAQGQR